MTHVKGSADYIHTACALWVPDIVFDDKECLDYASGVVKAKKKRKGLVGCGDKEDREDKRTLPFIIILLSRRVNRIVFVVICQSIQQA